MNIVIKQKRTRRRLGIVFEQLFREAKTFTFPTGSGATRLTAYWCESEGYLILVRSASWRQTGWDEAQYLSEEEPPHEVGTVLLEFDSCEEAIRETVHMADYWAKTVEPILRAKCEAP